MTTTKQNKTGKTTNMKEQQQQLYILDNTYTNKTVTEAAIEYGVTIPSEFICPITLEVMISPIMSIYGHNYEKDAILKWVGYNGRCPLTRQEIRLRDLIPNRILEKKIAMWIYENSLPKPIFISSSSTTSTTRRNNINNYKNDNNILVNKYELIRFYELKTEIHEYIMTFDI